MALSDNKPTNFKIEDWREWTDANDFPTFESDEATVRADLQYHPDFIKDKFNGMVEALEPYIEERIADVVVGELPDDSIQTEMIEDGAVTLEKLGEDVTPEGIGAADREHNHDDRYFTKEQFVDRQTRTDLLEEMDADLADGDMIPVYDASEDTNLKLDWENLKAAVKDHIDETFAEDEATYHASRHRPDGADPIHIATGNLDDQAVTNPKLSVITEYNEYHQTRTVVGLEADPELEHTTFSSTEDISDITFEVKDGELKAIARNLRSAAFIVTVTVSHEGEPDVGFNVMFVPDGWGTVPKTDESTAAVRFNNIKEGAVSTIYETTIPAFVDDGSAWEPVEEETEEEEESEEETEEEEEPVITGYTQTIDVEGLVSADEFTTAPEIEGVTFTIDEDDKLTATAETEPEEDIEVTVTQNNTDYPVTFPARKKKFSMETTGTPFTWEHDAEELLATDEVTLAVTPQPHDDSIDLCPYEEQVEIFEDCQIEVREVKDGSIEFTAFKKPHAAIWIRVSYPRSYAIASVSKNDWSREGDTDAWKQTVTVEGLPPWNEDTASHPDNHGVASLGKSTTSTGNDKAVYDRLSKVEIAEGGGAVDLTLDNGSIPGYNFQLGLQTIEYYDIKVEITDWIAHGAPVLVEVDVEGLLATDRPIIDLLPSELFTDVELELDSYGHIYRMVTDDGKLKVYASEPIETDLHIQIRAVRK